MTDHDVTWPEEHLRQPVRAQVSPGHLLSSLIRRPAATSARQPAVIAGGAPTSAILEGSLANLGLLPLLRFLCSLGKRGCVQLERAGWRGEICLEAGHVVTASFGEERGLLALDAILLALPQADFTFADSATVNNASNLVVDLDELALRPAGLSVRQRELAAAMPGPAAVPRIVPLEEANLDPAKLVLRLGTLHTLLAIDSQRTIEQLGEHRSSVQVLTDLAILMDLGLIHFDVRPSPALDVAS